MSDQTYSRAAARKQRLWERQNIMGNFLKTACVGKCHLKERNVQHLKRSFWCGNWTLSGIWEECNESLLKTWLVQGCFIPLTVVTEHLILTDIIWWMVGNGSVVRFGREGRDLCMARHTRRGFHRKRTNHWTPKTLRKSRQQSGFIQQDLYFYRRILSARNVEPTAVWMSWTEWELSWLKTNEPGGTQKGLGTRENVRWMKYLGKMAATIW